MADGAIRVKVSHLCGLAVVTVRGEINAVTAPMLDAALNELKLVKRMLLDLSGISVMDSTGAALLLAHGQRMNNFGGALLVRCPARPGSAGLAGESDRLVSSRTTY